MHIFGLYPCKPNRIDENLFPDYLRSPFPKLPGLVCVMGAHQPFCFFINTLTSFFLFCRELIKKVGGDMFSEHEIITICRHYGAKKVRKLRQQNHPFCACRNSPTPPFPWVFDEMSHTGGGLRVWKHGRDLTSNPIIFRADLYLFSTVRGG